MILRDITDVPVNMKTYGGMACTKVGVTINGKDYLVKYPSNLKAKNAKNTSLEYANSSLSEYIGSKVFELFGVPAHSVQLVLRNNKVCAMCEDFVTTGRLVEFRELKVTYEPGFVTPEGSVSDGTGTDLDEALTVIRNHHILKRLPEFETFFWRMFIIDAVIGNHDRNSGNFGICVDTSHVSLAPVYDNGNCLNPSWSDSKMATYLQDESKMIDVAYRVNTCRFTRNDKQINPFKLIASGIYTECTNALSILSTVNFEEIEQLIDSLDLVKVRSDFYKKVLKLRFNYLYDLKNNLSPTPEQIEWCRLRCAEALRHLPDNELWEYCKDAYYDCHR